MKSNGSKDSPWRDPMLHDKWTLKATLIILQRGARVIKSCPLQRWRSETKHDLLRSLLMGLSEDTLVQLHTTQKNHAKFSPCGGHFNVAFIVSPEVTPYLDQS